MKALKIMGKIFASILSVLLFFIFIFMMLFYSFKGMISSENLSDYVKDANILNIDINLIFNQEESGVTLNDKIYDLGLESGIPKEIISDMLKSEEINEILGDFFNKTIIYVIDGDNKPQISSNTISKMIEVARISLDNNINIMIDEEELDGYIYDYAVKLSNLIPERTEILNDFPIHLVSNVLNFNQLYIYLILTLIIVLIMVASMSIYKAIKYVSIPMIVAGVSFVVLGSMASILDNTLLSYVSNMKQLILPLITNFSAIIFKSGVLLSFSGLFLLIIYIVINRIIINNKKQKSLEETRRINIEDINIK